MNQDMMDKRAIDEAIDIGNKEGKKRRRPNIIKTTFKVVVVATVVKLMYILAITLIVSVLISSICVTIFGDDGGSGGAGGSTGQSSGQAGGSGGTSGGLPTGTSMDLFLEYLAVEELQNPPHNGSDKYKIYCDFEGNLAVGIGIDLNAQCTHLGKSLISIDESEERYDGYYNENGEFIEYHEVEYIHEERETYLSHQLKDLPNENGITREDKKNTTLQCYGLFDSTKIVYTTEYPYMRLIDKETGKAVLMDMQAVKNRKDQILDGIENNIRTTAEANNITLKEYQVHALMSRFYNTGENAYSFVTPYKNYWDEERDGKFGEYIEGDESFFQHDFFDNYMSTRNNGGSLDGRRRSEWILFCTGYYDNINKLYTDNYESEDILIRPVVFTAENGGYISSDFGPRTLPDGTSDVHKGVDYKLPEGTPIYAAHSGTVVTAKNWIQGTNNENDERSYGNYIIIKSDNGKFATLYAHCQYNGIKVSENQYVNQGDLIAYVGNTGHSFGAHLHFELRLDPENWKSSEYYYGVVRAEDYIGNDKLKKQGYLD